MTGLKEDRRVYDTVLEECFMCILEDIVLSSVFFISCIALLSAIFMIPGRCIVFDGELRPHRDMAVSTFLVMKID